MIMNAATLREILNHVPDDFEVEYLDNVSHPLQDKVEIDVSKKKIMLKSK